MQTYPKNQSTPNRLWEGFQLHMAPETDTLISDGLAPETAPAPALAPAPSPSPVVTPRVQVPRNGFLRQISLLLVFGVLCLGAYYMISRYVVTPVVIQGRSMTPTLRDGECYFLNRWVYMFKTPARSDLVVIKDPGHDDFAVKRIIAQPGDWLNLKGGKVYLNGQRLSESYLPKGTFTTTGDSREKWYQLGNDQFFVMGDNRACSEDSRVYGHILRGNILGVIRN